MKFSLFAIPILLIFASLEAVAKGQPSVAIVDKCHYWQAKIDPSVEYSVEHSDVPQDGKLELNSEPSERDLENAIEGIECLLKLKGRTYTSTYFSALTTFTMSTRFPPPSVEVAALHYISFLYHRNWMHARAIVLVDDKGRRNTKKSIKAAYKAYEAWFERVKIIGLQKAREDKLDPLSGTKVNWY